MLLNLNGALDERDHVAHAKDALSHAIGMERLKGIGLLALGNELDGLAGYLANGKGSAATGVAIHLGHDDAVEVDALGERLGNVHDVLTGHGINDHKDLVG